MPVRERTVEHITADAVGYQMWNNLAGSHCQTMPTEEYYQASDAADVLYERIIASIDFERILIEATSRHMDLDHPDNGATGGSVCGSCIKEALLAVDRWAAPNEPSPRRDKGQDWLAVLADMRKYKR